MDFLQAFDVAQAIFIIGSLHHCIGGVENELITRLNLQPCDYSSQGILTMIEYYSQLYDDLARGWLSDYQPKRDPLINWIEKARQHLRHCENLGHTGTNIRS